MAHLSRYQLRTKRMRMTSSWRLKIRTTRNENNDSFVYWNNGIIVKRGFHLNIDPKVIGAGRRTHAQAYADACAHADADARRRTSERRRKFHDRCGSHRASSNFRFSRNESRKSKTKTKSLKKNIFLGKKKHKSFAIERERASSDLSVECSYGIFFF